MLTPKVNAGATYVWNETLSINALLNIDADIEFQSNGIKFTRIQIDKRNVGGVNYIKADESSSLVYDTTERTWANEAYRTIIFYGEPTLSLQLFLNDNAVKI